MSPAPRRSVPVPVITPLGVLTRLPAVCSVAPVAVFSDNVAAGTEDNGFVLYPELCGASPQRILRNEVRTHLV